MTDELAADPFASWGERTPMYDEDGRLRFVFSRTESTRNGLPWADGLWRPPSVSVFDVADLVSTVLAGHAVSTSDSALAAELERRGGVELRHAHAMSHALARLPMPPHTDGFDVRALTAADVAAHADELGAISFRAYPPEHPDHEFDEVSGAVREMRGIALGEILGPYLDQSMAAWQGDRLIGACLLVDRPGSAPEGGPWIVDVFRDPDVSATGVGRALISEALRAAADDGLPSVSLVVSHGNQNAQGLYLSLGFVDAEQSWTLSLPDALTSGRADQPNPGTLHGL